MPGPMATHQRVDFFLPFLLAVIAAIIFCPALAAAQGQAASAGPPPANTSHSEVKPKAKAKAGETETSSGSESKSAGAPSTGQAAATAKPPAASKANTPPLQGDYIPCKFTPNELKSLVSPEMATTLSQADAEAMKQEVQAAAMEQEGGASPGWSDLLTFLRKLDNANFTSLTPSQALNKIIKFASEAQDEQKKPVTSADITDLSEQVKESVQTIDPSLALTAPLGKTVSNPVAQLVDDFVDQEGRKLEAGKGKITKGELIAKLEEEVTEETIKDDGEAASEAVPVTGKAGLLQPVVVAATADQIAQAYRLLASAIPAVKPTNIDAIIDAARNSLVLLERPTDVGCAMSILGWKETDLAYGHTIANEYIAVQVVVRNLSRDQQFVLHDVEFEVDTDPAGTIGRFYSGRDKVIVRALSEKQSSFDPRAITIHSLEGAGAILSAIVPIFSGVQSLAAAVGVYNGAFVPGFDKYWKDISGDQLNLLNDTAFSSAANSQISVPQLSTVMFVTFIPSKQFNEGWWTQPCVEKIYEGTVRGGKPGLTLRVPSRVEEFDTAQQDTFGDDFRGQPWSKDQRKWAPSPSTVASNIDILRALETCALVNTEAPRSKRHWYDAYKLYHEGDDKKVEEYQVADNVEGHAAGTPINSASQTDAQDKKVPESSGTHERGADQEQNQDRIDFFRNAYDRPYRKWSGTSLQLFSLLSNVVVAGAHITEDSQLQLSLSTVTCPSTKSGEVLFPTPDTGTLTCKLVGKNLEKIAQLRLRNAKDQTDATTAEGTVKVSGDSTSGTVEFSTAALHELPQPSYNVFTVTSKGVEEKTGQALHFSTDPYVSGLEPSSVDFTKDPGAAQVLQINGYHLEDINNVTFSNPADSTKKQTVTITLADAQRMSTQLTIPLSPANLTVFGTKTVTLDITLEVDKKASAVKVPALKFTGATPPKTDASKKASKHPTQTRTSGGQHPGK